MTSLEAPAGHYGSKSTQAGSRISIPVVSNTPRLFNPAVIPLDMGSSLRMPQARTVPQEPRPDFNSRLPPDSQRMNTNDYGAHISLHVSRPGGPSHAATLQPSNVKDTTAPQTTVYKPAVLHGPHPDSKLCQDFHWVPYPLGLMPYDSWHKLHHREDAQPSLPFRCPVCRQERKVTAHLRKVFLVAERLTWEEGLVSIHDKYLNEELNWKVNYEVGIMDPFIEDCEQVQGGKNSRGNTFYPYQNRHEMNLALQLIFMTEDITETTWALWIGTQLDLQRMLGEDEDMRLSASLSSPDPQHKTHGQTTKSCIPPCQKTPDVVESIDLTVEPDSASQLGKRRSHGLPILPLYLPKTTWSDLKLASVGEVGNAQLEIMSTSAVGKARITEPSSHDRRIKSYTSLQDFYSLLDKIERTSYVGALFLEAYAEKLRDDMCKSCWLNHNIKLDMY